MTTGIGFYLSPPLKASAKSKTSLFSACHLAIKKKRGWGGGGMRKHTFEVFSIIPVMCNSYLSFRCFLKNAVHLIGDPRADC